MSANKKILLNCCAVIILGSFFFAHNFVKAQDVRIQPVKREVFLKDGEVWTRETKITMKDRIEAEIRYQAREYGVNEDLAVRVAECESSLNPYATNKHSTAKGLYQWTDTSWKFIKAPGHQFDYKESAKQFAIWFNIRRDWWKSSEKCWNK